MSKLPKKSPCQCQHEKQAKTSASKVSAIAGPKKVGQLYDRIKKKSPGKSDEYYARVAWQVYCRHVNPDYKGCTEKGAGPEYVAPISSGIMTRQERLRIAKALKAAADVLDPEGA